MGTYRVVEPCAWVNDDGSVAHHRKPGGVVELSAETAADLGDAVEPLNGVQADARPKTRPREPKTKAAPKPIEQPVVSEPEPDTSDVVDASGE